MDGGHTTVGAGVIDIMVVGDGLGLALQVVGEVVAGIDLGAGTDQALALVLVLVVLLAADLVELALAVPEVGLAEPEAQVADTKYNQTKR